MSKLTTKAFDMAGQENCDGEEYDMIQELAERVKELEKRITWGLRVKRSGMVGFTADMLRGNWEYLDANLGSYTLQEYVEATEREDNTEEININ
jgi:hypothetical protein